MTATHPHGSKRQRILIVDDELPVLHSLQRTLRDERYQFVEACSGEDALRQLRNGEFALIICDQFLPDIQGVQVLQEATKHQPHAVRIIMTGSEDLNVVIQAINVGQISQYVQKPWDAETLRGVVRAAVERFELAVENQLLQKRLVDQHRQLQNNHQQLQKELQIGARIHRVMLRGEVPANLMGLTLDAMTEPSKEIDGDFFDFYTPAEKTFDLVMGDVMGKGLPAALIGTAVKTQLRRFATGGAQRQVFTEGAAWREDVLPARGVLEAVQKEVGAQLLDLEYFVTLFYGRFQFDQWRFNYVDCGSTKPVHYSKRTGKTRLLRGDNYPLGTIPEDIFLEKEVYYEEGDLFVFYSDGLTEAQSEKGELYGEQRLQDFVKANAHLPPRALQHLLHQSIATHSGKQELQDDLTIIVVRMERVSECLSSAIHTAKFFADLSQLDAARSFVGEVCQKAPGDSTRLSQQMQLVVNEAFCNVVRHGSGDTIVIRIQLKPDGLALELADQGEPFDPTAMTSLDLAGKKDGGYGLFMMKEILDRVGYVPKSTQSGWNHLQMHKSYYLEEVSMEFKHSKLNDVLVVALEGSNLDAREAPSFKEQITDLIQQERAGNVVFDLSKLQFIDSSGLGSFLSILRQLNTHGGDLKLAQMTKPIKTMFEVVRMHKLFDIFTTTEDAIRSFQPNAR